MEDKQPLFAFLLLILENSNDVTETDVNCESLINYIPKNNGNIEEWLIALTLNIYTEQNPRFTWTMGDKFTKLLIQELKKLNVDNKNIDGLRNTIRETKAEKEVMKNQVTISINNEGTFSILSLKDEPHKNEIHSIGTEEQDLSLQFVKNLDSFFYEIKNEKFDKFSRIKFLKLLQEECNRQPKDSDIKRDPEIFDFLIRIKKAFESADILRQFEIEKKQSKSEISIDKNGVYLYEVC